MQMCGAKGIQRIDFGLRRRVCTSCFKEKYVYSFHCWRRLMAFSQRLVVASKFRVRFPDYAPLVMDLLPYTNSASVFSVYDCLGADVGRLSLHSGWLGSWL